MPEAPADINRALSPEGWFQSLPVITRWWFGVALASTLGVGLGFLNPMYLYFDWTNITNKFEIWRFATSSCFAGGFDIKTLMRLHMLLTFSRQYEEGGPFNTGGGGGSADYAFALVFGIAMCCLTYPLLMGYISSIFCRNMISFVMYLWSRRNATASATLWVVPVPALYVPFAYLALEMLMGHGYFDILHGILIGHMYYFLVDVYPSVYGKDILRTPQIFVEQLGVGAFHQGRRAETNTAWNNPRPAQQRADARPSRGYNWGGQGQRLGDS